MYRAPFTYITYASASVCGAKASLTLLDTALAYKSSVFTASRERAAIARSNQMLRNDYF